MPDQPSIPTATTRRSHASTHCDAAKNRSPLKSLSTTESYEGPFEKILDQQDARMRSVIKKMGTLNKKNQAAFNTYNALTKDNIDKIDASLFQDAEKLLKKLKITLISDFDSITSLEAAINENILVPKTSDGQIWIDFNPELATHMIQTHQYLRGKIPALKPVLNLKIPRLTPEELFEKINQAAIEKFFYCLELLITEMDIQKKLKAEEKSEQLYNMILLSFAQKLYSLKFLNWYEKNKGKIEQLLTCEEKNRDIPNLEKKVSAMKKYISAIQEELDKKTEELGKAHDYVELLEKEKNELKESLKNEIEKSKSDANKIKELKKEICAKDKQISTITSSLNQTNQELSKKEYYEELLKEENAIVTKKMDALINEINTLKQSMDQKQTDHLKIENSLKDDIKQQERQITLLEQEKSSLKEEKSELQTQNEFLVQKVAELNKKLNEEKTSTSDIKVMLESLINRFESFMQSNNNLINESVKSQYEQNQRQLEELKNQLKSILESDCQKKDGDINQIKTRLESLIQHIIKNTHDLQQLTDKFESSQQKNEGAHPSQKKKNTTTITITTTTTTKITHPIVLSDLFKTISCPISVLKDLKIFQDSAVNSSNRVEISEQLEKLFKGINNSELLKKYPQASAELTKFSICMVYSLVQKGKITPSSGVNLLLSIRPSIGTFIDRAPLALYLATFAYLIQSEPNSEAKNSQKINIIQEFSEKKEGIDLYKIIKQWIKDNYRDKYKKNPINLPKDLEQALIQFKQAGLIPNKRELYQFIDINQENSKCNIFSEYSDIKEKDVKNVEKLKEVDIKKESYVERSNFFRRSVLRRGSVKIKRLSNEDSVQTSTESSGRNKIVYLTTNTSGFYSQAKTKEHEALDLGVEGREQLTQQHG